MTALILFDKYQLSDYIITKYPDNYENIGKVAYIPENIEILERYKNINLETATANWYNNFVVNMYDVKLIWDKKTRNNN